MDNFAPERSLTPENVVCDFGIRSANARICIGQLLLCLTRLIDHDAVPQVLDSFKRWRLLFCESTGRDLSGPLRGKTPEFERYAKRLGIETSELNAARLVFAVHTYYAMLAKMLAVKSLDAYGLAGASPWENLTDQSDATLLSFVKEIETGKLLEQANVLGFAGGDPFGWYTQAWNPDVAAAVRGVMGHIAKYDFTNAGSAADPRRDILKGLYQGLVPRGVRHQLGEYYTPDWLAEHVLDRLGYEGQMDLRLLDPSCGSGTFLVQAIGRLRRRCHQEGIVGPEALSVILGSLVGIDLNPLAVLAARVNYLLAVADLTPDYDGPIDLPVHLGDSILSPDDNRDLFSVPEPNADLPAGRFDVIVGNPPWIGWESLPEDYRRQLKPLWIRYGLFPHRGMSAILGQGKKDLSMLMSYAATDRWLKPGGKLGFVITQSVFKTAGAGKAFRRFCIGKASQGAVRVECVDDMSDFQPFEEASTRTATFVWTKGEPTEFPVPYHLWQKNTRGRAVPQQSSLAEVHADVRRLAMAATPVDQEDVTSPWLTARSGLLPVLSRLFGNSGYRAHEGVNTGGANAVYWLEVLERRAGGLLSVRNIVEGARRRVAELRWELEPDLVYPLLRGREVRRWQAEPSASILLVQDVDKRRGVEPSWLESHCPQTYAYLLRFEEDLRSRAAFRRYFTRDRSGRRSDTAPFYSMFDVGRYTLAPNKVVWHRMVAPVQAAVVGLHDERPVLPQETHAFVACERREEAFYLCGMVNSLVFNFAASSYSQAGGKSFASPHILDHVNVPVFDPGQSSHRLVSEIAAGIQQNATNLRPAELAIREHDLDTAAAAVWGISDEAFAEIRKAYRQLRKADVV